MRAMILEQPGKPLVLRDCPVPEPRGRQVQLQVLACAVCRTDLHVVDGELPNPKLPLILGHEIVGRVTRVGEQATLLSVGQRVGVPWLGWTCGECSYCRAGKENLCPKARFTGYTLDGGYAEFTVADERYCVPIPESYSDAGAAPLLCAGLIGYRSLVRAGDAKRLGIYGFGAAAHIVAQVALHQGRSVYAFTRPAMRGAAICERAGRGLGRSIGRASAGGTGRRDYFCARRRAGARRAGRRSQGRNGRLRRHSHERHPLVSLRFAVGRKIRLFGRESDAQGRRGIHGNRAQSSGAHDDPAVRARTGQRGVKSIAKRKAARRCGSDWPTTIR